jgi:nitroreductase
MSSHPVLDEWSVSELEYPAAGTVAEQLRFLIGYAILAPSSHNTQPWRFRVRDHEVDVLADRTRALEVLDPEHRELVISCGAALFHLRLALRYFGREAIVALTPLSDDPDLLAVVRVGPERNRTVEDELLFRAMPERHTNRLAADERPLPGALTAALPRAAAAERAWLRTIEGPELRSRVADLIVEADLHLFGDRRYRHELAAWMRPNDETSRDGVPGFAYGIPDPAAPLGRRVVELVNSGRLSGFRDRRLALNAPALLVLGTSQDAPKAWMAAGQALARVLLHAAARGVWACYLNQPLQVPELRRELAALLELEGSPHLLLRLGAGETLPHTPRRDVEQVLLP